MDELDHGYSWVIAVAAFFSCNILFAVHVSFSVFYIDLCQVLSASKAQVGVIYALRYAFINFPGIFIKPFIERYGFTAVSLAGTFLATGGLVLGSFSTNLVMLCVTYGALFGLGTCCLLMTAFTIPQYWFSKRRKLVNGFIMVAVPLSIIYSPILSRVLIHFYGWRGAILMTAAFCLQTAIPGVLYRQPPSSEPSKKSVSLMTHTKNVFDFLLLRNVQFTLYCIGCCLMSISFFSTLVHLPSKAVSQGLTLMEASMVLTIMAVSDTLSRMVYSFIVNMRSIDCVLAHSLGTIAGGIVNIASFATVTYTHFIVYSVCYGICTSIFMTVQQSIIVELLSVKVIVQAQAIFNIFLGVSGLVAIPFAGWIYDVTNDYDITFYILGGLQVLGGAFVLIVAFLHRRETRSNQENIQIK